MPDFENKSQASETASDGKQPSIYNRDTMSAEKDYQINSSIVQKPRRNHKNASELVGKVAQSNMSFAAGGLHGNTFQIQN
jgi:hypothetical protein